MAKPILWPAAIRRSPKKLKYLKIPSNSRLAVKLTISAVRRHGPEVRSIQNPAAKSIPMSKKRKRI
jgi:hypothetical protein